MSQVANFVWSIADQLRGVYKPNKYGDVILPMTILRRMECVLEPHRDRIAELAKTAPPDVLELLVRDETGLTFYNTSPYSLERILEEPENLRGNLKAYLDGFSGNVADLFTHYKFDVEIDTLDTNDRLFLILDRFAKVDLGPRRKTKDGAWTGITNTQMGTLFEDLIRRFAAASNETAGEHFTPRDAVRLLVDLLVEPDSDVLTGHVVRTVYDPTAGTGGMLSVLDERLTEMNPRAEVVRHGQELNAQSYAICKSELIGKGQDADNIALGGTLANDQHFDKRFDYVLSNPPYGGDWKASQSAVLSEVAADGGRFPGGVPPINDGQMLFLQLVASKMRPPSQGGGRAGIVLNGSPLFSGGAESGPSEIRRYLLESDLVDAIVALPTDMFFNTGIAKAKALAGWKAYVTNLPDPEAEQVIGAYRRLFQIERSFRMAKSDLAARPIYHRKQDSIEAHLTIVFAAMAVAHWIEQTTGWSIKRFVKTARRYRTVTIAAGDHVFTAADPVPDELDAALKKIEAKSAAH